jgi:hypothetical protein
VSNIEIEKMAVPKQLGTEEYLVHANFVIYELQVQSTRMLDVWPGGGEYRLRQYPDGEIKMYYKKIMLVEAGEPILTAAFIL